MKEIILLFFSLFPCLIHAGLVNTDKFNKDGYLIYKGQETLSGTYFQSNDDFGETTCFFVNKKDSKKIPRLPGDNRSAWFCFTNKEVADRIFKLPQKPKKGICYYKGIATVTIQNYFVYRQESEGFDLTKLISAKNISSYKSEKCVD